MEVSTPAPSPGTETAPAAVSTPPSDWRPFMNDDLRADQTVSDWAAKTDYKDIPALIKGMAHAQKRMGSTVNFPGKDAKPADVAAFKQRLYDAGLFAAPPTDRSAYAIAKPERLPDGIAWNEELAQSFGDTLLKHGAPPALAQDLLALYEQSLAGRQAQLAQTAEASIAALKAEHGAQFDERMEVAERLAQGIFTDPEEIQFFKDTGLGKSPRFLSVLMRLAPLAMSDSSFLPSLPAPGGQISGDEAKRELMAIMSDPKHPMYEGYRRRDVAVNRHIDNLYRQAYGSGQAVGG